MPPREPRSNLLPGISKLFNNPDHSDVDIYLGTYHIPAHSIILTTQSSYFNTALKSQFSEGKTKQFHFNKGSMHAYWRVLRYMYTGRYLNDAADVLGLADDEELIKDVRVYALADLFLMDDLKKQATRRLASRLEDARGDETLVHCIKEVYNFTSDDDSHEELRDLVSEKAYSAVRHLWKLDEFRELVRDGGDFVVDFVAQKAERR